MARIGIFSDSHEHIEYIREIMASFSDNNVDLIIHCGDLISPIMARAFTDFNCPFHFVYGNNDGEKLYLESMLSNAGVTIHVGPTVIEHAGLKILFMHEPVEVDALAETGRYDLICYGHTHDLRIEKIGKTQVVNPGESCGLLTGRKTAVIYDNEKGCEVIEL